MPHTIKKSLTIAAPIHKVWSALTEPKVIGTWMDDANVKVTLRKGGRYAFFGSETSGKFTTIHKPITLEYTWRQHEWKKEWKDSIVRWELKADGDTTVVKLTHTNFPNKEERDGHDDGWDVYWLQPMTLWLRTSD